mmetsp:Transcript_55942/g.173638  ORF Transcript_55942/g.173638 Transcript_55942/m.173638 type:complete len:413 (+) Transcript_55942:29-1267(+)
MARGQARCGEPAPHGTGRAPGAAGPPAPACLLGRRGLAGLAPLRPRGHDELADHVVDHRGKPPEAELAAVRAAPQLRQRQVRVGGDVVGEGLHVLPDADGVVPGVDHERRDLDLIKARLLHVEPGAAVARARQPLRQLVRVPEAAPGAHEVLDEVAGGGGLRPELVAVPEGVAVLDAQVQDPAVRRLHPRHRAVGGDVVARVVAHRAEQLRPARGVVRVAGGPGREVRPRADVAPSEAGATGEADDGHGPPGLPPAHAREHVVEVLVEAEHRELRARVAQGHAAVAAPVHHRHGHAAGRQAPREVAHRHAAAVLDGAVQQHADRPLPPRLRGRLRAGRRHPVHGDAPAVVQGQELALVGAALQDPGAELLEAQEQELQARRVREPRRPVGRRERGAALEDALQPPVRLLHGP